MLTRPLALARAAAATGESDKTDTCVLYVSDTWKCVSFLSFIFTHPTEDLKFQNKYQYQITHGIRHVCIVCVHMGKFVY